MKKTKHLIVRITESQFRRLADALLTEQMNKSTIVRAALDQYLYGVDKSPDKEIQKHNQINRS